MACNKSTPFLFTLQNDYTSSNDNSINIQTLIKSVNYGTGQDDFIFEYLNGNIKNYLKLDSDTVFTCLNATNFIQYFYENDLENLKGIEIYNTLQ